MALSRGMGGLVREIVVTEGGWLAKYGDGWLNMGMNRGKGG